MAKRTKKVGIVGKFLMRMMRDDDREINLAGAGADTEFAQWKWEDPDEVIEQAVDYKRPADEEVLHTFRAYLREDGGGSGKCKSSKW